MHLPRDKESRHTLGVHWKGKTDDSTKDLDYFHLGREHTCDSLQFRTPKYGHFCSTVLLERQCIPSDSGVFRHRPVSSLQN